MNNLTTEAAATAKQTSQHHSGFAPLVFSLLIGLGTLLLYNSALQNGFVSFDDPDYVTANARVLQGLSWSNIGWAMTSVEVANWHPLTWISHMTAVELFKLNPMGHHLINVLLHSVNAALLFLLLRRATGFTRRSVAVAVLWAVHPLAVESVAWVSERKGLLCTLFMILTLYAYTGYARRPGVRGYLAVAALFALALMSKPMAVTLPFLLLLFDYWPLRRLRLNDDKHDPETGASLGRLTAEKIPLAAMAVGASLITFLAQRGDGTVGALAALPLRFRIINAVYSYFAYLLKCFWPTRLAIFYPHPEGSLPWWKFALACVFLAGMTFAVMRSRRRRYLMGWLWYLVALIPVIGIVQVGRQAMADRYAYVPLIGIFIIIVWLGSDLAERLHVPGIATGAAVAVAALALAWVTHLQISYWRNSVELFAHAEAVTPENYTAESGLSAALDQAGHPDLAVPHALAALRLEPYDARVHYQLATALQHLNRPDASIPEYRQAIALSRNPQLIAVSHNNVGAMLLDSGRPDDALAEFNAALAIDPRRANSLMGRGLIEYQKGQRDAAQQDFANALRVAPSATGFYWLGRTLEDKGDLRSAAAAYQSGLTIAPDMTDMRVRLEAIQLRLR